MPKRDYELYLDDIREAADKIVEYTHGVARPDFEKNSMLIDAVIRNIGIIGEAARHLPEDIRARYREVSWYEILGMRNLVIHEYWGINMDILWRTVQDDIPTLRDLLANGSDNHKKASKKTR